MDSTQLDARIDRALSLFKQKLDQLISSSTHSGRENPEAPPAAKRAKVDLAANPTAAAEALKEALNNLIALSTEHGLTEAQLVIASEWVPIILSAPQRFASSLLKTLVKKIMIPRCWLPFDALVNIVGPLHHTLLLEDDPTRVSLLEYNAVVLPLVTPQSALRSLYQLYFRLMLSAALPKLRFCAAQIVYRITRKQDVNPARQRALNRALSTCAALPVLAVAPLQAVQALYRELVPEGLAPSEQVQPVLPAASSRGSAGWSHVIVQCAQRGIWQRMWAVHHRNNAVPAPLVILAPPELPNALPKQRNFEQYWLQQQGDAAGSGSAAAAYTSSVSSTVPPHAPVQSQPQLQLQPAVEGREALIKFESFVRAVGSTENGKPESVETMLTDRSVQQWILLDRNELTLQRWNDWLHSLLDASTPHSRVLEWMATLAESLQETPAPVIHYLKEFMTHWDGKEHWSAILKLLSWYPPLPWEDLFASTLRPLGKIYFTLTSVKKAQLLDTLTTLLRHWLQLDWAQYHRNLKTGSQPEVPPLDMGFTLTAVETSRADYYRTLYEFVRYVDQLAAITLHSETAQHGPSSVTDHVAVQHSVLNFFDVVSRLHSRYGLPFVVTPSPGIVYRCLLSNNAAALSRVCGILARYKEEFDRLKTVMSPQADSGSSPTAPESLLSFPNGAEKIFVLNCYIWSFCGALWRQRLFFAPPNFLKDELTLPASLLDEIRFDGIQSCLGVTHSPAMLSLSREYLTALERALHPGAGSSDAITLGARGPSGSAAAAAVPVGAVMRPDMIKEVVKEHFVEYLKNRGMHGLHQFLFSFIAALVRRRTDAAPQGAVNAAALAAAQSTHKPL